MLPLLLVVLWTSYCAVALRAMRGAHSRIDHPAILFLLPQVAAMALLVTLDALEIVKPAVDLDFTHAAFLILASTLFVAAVGVGSRGNRTSQELTLRVPTRLASVAFWMCFLIGSVGTALLLLNIGISNLAAIYVALTTDFNALEDTFFNSGAAILWQANIAAAFWFGLMRKPSLFARLAICVCFASVLFRGAFLYVIIASFYFLIPRLYTQARTAALAVPALALIGLVNLIVFLSYDFGDSIGEIYLTKTYPYISGNFVNLFRHIDMALGQQWIAFNSIDDLVEGMGFSSIFTYLRDYFGVDFRPPVHMVFFPQATNAPVFGNTHTIYGQVVHLPILLGLTFWILLGLLLGKIYRLAPTSLFFLSIHTWFSAATFLSFAGAGHFTTTRFFPAVLFVWPFLAGYWFLTALPRTKPNIPRRTAPL